MSLPLLIIATRNAHKTSEIRSMLEGQWEVRDLSDFPQAPPVEETGTTFLENATLKAISASKVLPGIILADDSGLEVDALGGRPGVWSSSFGGEEGNHALNNEFMLAELARVNAVTPEDCSARFLCTMVLAREGEVLAHFEGKVEGHMVRQLSGTEGFGYDPLFVPEGYDLSFAELGSDIKNGLSHRARALAEVVNWLKIR